MDALEKSPWDGFCPLGGTAVLQIHPRASLLDFIDLVCSLQMDVGIEEHRNSSEVRHRDRGDGCKALGKSKREARDAAELLMSLVLGFLREMPLTRPLSCLPHSPVGFSTAAKTISSRVLSQKQCPEPQWVKHNPHPSHTDRTSSSGMPRHLGASSRPTPQLYHPHRSLKITNKDHKLSLTARRMGRAHGSSALCELCLFLDAHPALPERMLWERAACRGASGPPQPPPRSPLPVAKLAMPSSA